MIGTIMLDSDKIVPIFSEKGVMLKQNANIIFVTNVFQHII